MRFVATTLLVFLLLLIGGIFSFTTQAISQFSTDYQITYTIQPDGTTKVNYDIAQTNNLSSIYATHFSLSVSQTDLKNIHVEDTSGPLTPEVVTTKNLSNISFDFVGKVAGRGKINNFSLSYETGEIATQVGSIWEINIPKLATDESANSIIINLIVPEQLGKPAFISPSPSKVDANIFQFNAISLANRPISAVFGQNQYFEFDLFYNLENPAGQAVEVQVALPPDTTYQKVLYKNLEPQPKKIESDPDGNWLATLELAPKSELKFKAQGVVKLSMKPQKRPLLNKQEYLKPQPLWPSDTQIVQIAAGQISGNAKSIYDFVVGSLSYDYTRLEKSQIRPGAKFALENPSQAICTEFADLFVTLARNKGIPARELEGFAFSTNEKLRPLSLNKDVLHAWVEYYDAEAESWIQIDPTWANTTQGIDYFTKLDLNHFVFAIHGSDPQNPPPAGSYKTHSTNSKDIYVNPSSPVDFPLAQLDIKIVKVGSDEIGLEIRNDSPLGVSAPLQALDPSIKLNYKDYLSLAPFETRTVFVALPDNSEPAQNLSLIIDNKQYDFNLKQLTDYRPLFLAGGSLALLFTLISGYLYLRRQKQGPPVRW